MPVQGCTSRLPYNHDGGVLLQIFSRFSVLGVGLPLVYKRGHFMGKTWCCIHSSFSTTPWKDLGAWLCSVHVDDQHYGALLVTEGEERLVHIGWTVDTYGTCKASMQYLWCCRPR